MPYEDPIRSYVNKDPERKLRLFKIYTRILMIIPFLIAFGVIMFILIELGVI